jgi:hypothetical protein
MSDTVVLVSRTKGRGIMSIQTAIVNLKLIPKDAMTEQRISLGKGYLM